jgi:phenylalanyl-tRNA synthetase beta chain
MKVSQVWLQEWLPSLQKTDQWVDQLVMAGLEVGAITPAAPLFNNVVVGKVLHCGKHPNADRLSLCRVDVGQAQPLSIVCGASNVREGLHVAVALVGAELPNGFKIKSTQLRGVVSEGMICSGKELGLTDEDCSGILELASNAPIGQLFRDYWQLDDEIVEVEITPNRGDCLSMQGMAREISAILRKPYKPLSVKSVKPTIKDVKEVIIEAQDKPLHYLGRLMRHVDVTIPTPLYIQERLRRQGVRCINIVVDILNYVMFELGQPMHAFDLAHLTGDIHVRYAKMNEKITLLDHTEMTLDENTLVIADDRQPCAIAGIMGGLDSGVTLKTKDIFIESAFFSPACVCRSVQAYALHSDSSYRFERGVDPQLQRIALERATALLHRFAGGDIGPIVERMDKKYLPCDEKIVLRKHRLTSILGIDMASEDIVDILTVLNMPVKATQDNQWLVTKPSYRFDIEQEIDLIEEVIRLYGYHHIVERPCTATMTLLNAESEKKVSQDDMATVFIGRGYHEIITYSFVDKALQGLLVSDEQAIPLSNPLSADMAWMRTSLWPGLIKTARYNQNRQMERIRIFEIGLCFRVGAEGNIIQEEKIGGLVAGPLYPAQWGVRGRGVDFFDLKADIEALLKLTHRIEDFSFKPMKAHDILYLSQSAALYDRKQCIGYLGALHPTLMKKLKLTAPLYVFEFLLQPLTQAQLSRANAISKFPSISRDIALIVDRAIMADQIKQFISSHVKWLKNVQVFDVYVGKNLREHEKSIALRLTFSDISRTLKEQEINDQLSTLVLALQQEFNAILRGSS